MLAHDISERMRSLVPRGTRFRVLRSMQSWWEFVLAYRVMFNPPGQEVREVLLDFDHMGVVSRIEKKPAQVVVGDANYSG